VEETWCLKGSPVTVMRSSLPFFPLLSLFQPDQAALGRKNEERACVCERRARTTPSPFLLSFLSFAAGGRGRSARVPLWRLPRGTLASFLFLFFFSPPPPLTGKAGQRRGGSGLTGGVPDKEFCRPEVLSDEFLFPPFSPGFRAASRTDHPSPLFFSFFPLVRRSGR